MRKMLEFAGIAILVLIAATIVIGVSTCVSIMGKISTSTAAPETSNQMLEDGITSENAAEDAMQAAHEAYKALTAPADDDIDFMFESDYRWSDLVRVYEGMDACSYGPILGITEKVTIQDIEAVLDTNENIDSAYKTFIRNYVQDYLALYPDADFRVFYHNLKTLSVSVVDKDTLIAKTMAMDTAACYLKQENQIMLLDGEDFSKGTDNYIILTHELTHCARCTWQSNENGDHVDIAFFEHYLMGTYAEEGIITNIAYEMEGLGNWAEFYPFQSSCMRIIADCVGFDGADFMNHSVNYLIYLMDDFMGEEDHAYYIIALLDSISYDKYTPTTSVDFDNYQDLCDYLTRMYMKKYLSEDMDTTQAEEVYTAFIRNITYRFDTMTNPYPITADNFRPAFLECMEELGIA